MPHELDLAGIYVSPVVLIIPAALAAAVLTAVVLNLTHLSRFLANPPWVFIALFVLYSCLLGQLTGTL